MPKLKLDIEALEVATFSTNAAVPAGDVGDITITDRSCRPWQCLSWP